MALVLGLDIGSTSTKVVLVEVSTAVHIKAAHSAPTPHTVEALRAAIAALITACLRSADSPIAAVGIASMAESGAAIAADGTGLTELLRWDRHVHPRHLQTLLAARPDLAEFTGVPATTKPAAVALIELQAEHPTVLRRMQRWMGVADIATHALTGVFASDHTLAARTMLMQGDSRQWNTQLLDDLSLSARMLPDIVAPTEPAGFTHANALGLPPGIPVYIGGHDHAVGAWALGARDEGHSAVSLGTAEAVIRITKSCDRVGAVSAGFAVSRTVDDTAATIMGGSRSCGAMLTWWSQRHPADDTLARLQAAIPTKWTTSPLTVLPYPAGRQCPQPNPNATVITSIAPGHDDVDADERSRAVLQAIILQSRWMRDYADDLAGSLSNRLMVLGSLLQRIPAWGPLLACSGIPTISTDVHEPVAAGAALLAAVRSGLAPHTAHLPTTDIRPSQAPGLDDAYQRFRALLATEPQKHTPKDSPLEENNDHP
ncbi:FGGY family carbohydrate kinase [Microbacterium sp. YY-01]|uniref:FGGY family carbohydrate kinase n=1 Tax=Microbacterium sp. YY-01 TaxID=3421634 RepID=UPI003D162A61